MLKQIRKWLEPPIFPGDEVKNAQARLMNTMGLYFVSALVLAAAIYVPFLGNKKAASGATILVLFVIYLLSRIFMFSGKMTLATLFIVTSTWMICEGLLVSSGGITSAMLIAIAAIAIAVGLMVDPRIGTAFLVLNILIGLVVAVLQQSGVPLPQVFVHSPLGAWFIFTLSMVFINWAMRLTMHNLENALALAQHQNDAREKAEAVLRENEEKYRLLFDNAGDAIFVHDKDARVLAVNSQAVERLGYMREELLGMTIDQVDSLEESQYEAERIELIMRQGYLKFETIHQHKDGSLIPTEVCARRVVWDGIPAIMSIYRDITERKRVEDALRTSEQHFKTLVENTPDIIARFDRDLRHVFVNKAMERIFHSRVEMLLGKSHRELGDLPEQQIDFSERIIRQVFETGQPVEFETSMPGSNGLVYLSSRGVPELDEQGMIKSALFIHRDITARKKVEEKLRTSQEETQAILNAIPDIMFEVDEEGHFINYYAPSQETLYVSPEVFMHKTIEDVLPKPAASVIMNALEQAGRQGWHRGATFSLDLPAGKSWFELSIQAKSGDPGLTRRFIILAHDITARKHAEEMERELRTLAEALSNSTAALNSTLKFHEVLDRVLDNVGRVMPHDAANIMLLDADGDTLSLVCHRGYIERDAKNSLAEHFSLAMFPILSMLARNGQSLVIPDTRANPAWISFPATSWVCSYLTAPIRVRQRTVGFLNLDSAMPGFYNSNHIERLQAFADQAAIAIENARLYEEVQKLAVTDKLTGIFNRTFFEAELARMEQGRDFPVSVVVADLDNMKTTNDRLGHPAGDQLLQDLAQILQETFRASDIIARIGGDEFAILLPNTDATTAGQVLSRVHIKLAEHNAQHPELPIHLSLGVSTAEQGKLMEAFILADQRMYADKAMRKLRK